MLLENEKRKSWSDGPVRPTGKLTSPGRRQALRHEQNQRGESEGRGGSGGPLAPAACDMGAGRRKPRREKEVRPEQAGRHLWLSQGFVP